MNRRNVSSTSSPTHSADSSCGWADELSYRLIQHAARKAPPELSERLEEEWLADLSARQGAASRVLFGLGCCWATNVIAREHYALNVSAATSAAGSTTMTAYAQYDSTFFSRRTAALATIVALHVAVIYAFATGLTSRFSDVIPPSMEAVFLPDTQHITPPQPPPTRDVVFADPHIDLGPPPIIKIENQIDQTDETNLLKGGTTNIGKPDVIQPAKVDAPIKRVTGGPGKGFPNSADYYPAAARRLGEQGSATVQVCTDQEGRLTANPTVAHSSGFTRLDEGALKLAKAGSGHYRATTENGAAVNACYPFRITFDLKD